MHEDAHRVAAQLAMAYLSDPAKVAMQDLYGENWAQEVVNLSASVELSLSRPANAGLRPLQVTLFELNADGFSPENHCQQNACSVAAVLESREVLSRSSFSDFDKRQAVVYLLHYVLQLHVPVNAGLQRDEGGQKIYLKDNDLNAVNFAWIWNVDLYAKLNKRWFSLAQEWHRQIDDTMRTEWSATADPQDWVWETHQIALEQAYPMAAPGRYNAQFVKQGQALLIEQIQKAAVRSAALLNALYSDGAS